MSARLHFDPATRFSLRQLAAFFNAAYEGYAHPVGVTPEGLARRVHEESLDLAASQVMEIKGEPVGLFLVGRRHNRAWCGGFGINKPQRGRGLAGSLVTEMIARTRATGAKAFQLEVLSANVGARRVYERAGFQATRELVVYSSTPAPPNTTALAAFGRADVLDHLRAVDREAPLAHAWQREVASLHARTDIEAFEVKGGASGVLFSRMPDGSARLMSLRGPADRELGELVQALAASVTRLLVINEPAESPYHALLRAAGLLETTRQHEMRLPIA